MIVVQAPKDIHLLAVYLSPKVFLAGGITNCPNWQQEFIDHCNSKDPDYTRFALYNPRRDDFDINDPHATEEQITWVFEKLKESDVIVFWFSRGSINPIVLYELGMWGNSREKKIFVGVDEEYPRKGDVYIQTMLARNEVYLDIVTSVKQLADKLCMYMV